MDEKSAIKILMAALLERERTSARAQSIILIFSLSESRKMRARENNKFKMDIK